MDFGAANAEIQPDCASHESLRHRQILGMRVDASTYADATDRILNWATEPTPRQVCVANVHMTMEAYDSRDFQEIVNSSDMVTSDGMPLVWMLRRLGLPQAERVYGPTLTLHVCEVAAKNGTPVGFYGGSPEAITGIQNEFTTRFPKLDVRYAYSPPFRQLTPEEDDQITKQIHESGARILFVGLGCPKQERWMAAHKDRLPLVQLGVGAAFDFHAGKVKQAPSWLQDRGLEWLFRLAVEPRRLWRRYLYNNPRFLMLAALQLATRRQS